MNQDYLIGFYNMVKPVDDNDNPIEINEWITDLVNDDAKLNKAFTDAGINANYEEWKTWAFGKGAVKQKIGSPITEDLEIGIKDAWNNSQAIGHGVAGDLFNFKGPEAEFQSALTKLIGGYGFKVDQADWLSDKVVKVTNKNDVSEKFNLSKGEDELNKLISFLKEDKKFSPEFYKERDEFSNELKKEYFGYDEKTDSFNFDQLKNLTDDKYLQDLEIKGKSDRKISRVVRRDLEMKSLFGFGIGGKERTKYLNLANSDIDKVIEDTYYELLSKELKIKFDQYQSEQVKVLENKNVDSEEFFKQNRQNLISTFADPNERAIAESIEKINHGGLSETEIQNEMENIRLHKQKIIDSDKWYNKKGYKPHINLLTGEIINKVPENIPNPGNYADISNDVESAASDLKDSDLDTLEERFNSVQLQKARIISLMNEKSRYKHGYGDGIEGEFTLKQMMYHNVLSEGGAEVGPRAVPLDANGNPTMSAEEFERYTKRMRADYIDIMSREQALKKMYLLNEDVMTVEKEHWKTTKKMIVSGFIGDQRYKEKYGITTRETIDSMVTEYDEVGFKMTGEQQDYIKRTTAEQINEAISGSAAMLVGFYFGNKLQAGLQTLKLFKVPKRLKPLLDTKKSKYMVEGMEFTGKRGYISINDYLAAVSKRRYIHTKTGQTANEYQLRSMATKYNKRRVKKDQRFKKNKPVTWEEYAIKAGYNVNKTVSPSRWGGLQSLLYTGLAEGIKFKAIGGEFETGFGFGLTGKILTPLMPVIKNSNRWNSVIKHGVTGPVSFAAGSEIGELMRGISDDMFNIKGMDTYMKKHYGDSSEYTQRWIVNLATGFAFSLSHAHAWDTKSYESIKDVRAESRELFENKYTEATKLLAEGKTEKSWEALQEGRKWEEVYHKANSRIKQFDSNKDFYDPLLAVGKVKKQYKGQIETYEKNGYKLEYKLYFGNEKNFKDKFKDNKINASFRETKTGGKKTMLMEINMKNAQPGVAQHEIGHAGMTMLFRDKVFTDKFFEDLNNVAREIKLEEINAKTKKRYTLHEKLVEMRLDQKWNKQKDHWETFSYIAETLSKEGNINQLKGASAWGKLGNFIQGSIGKKLGHDYNFTQRKDIVKFLANYVESINAGGNSVKILKHLDKVMNKETKKENLYLKQVYNSEVGLTAGAKKRQSIISENKKLIEKHFDSAKGGWLNKTAEAKYKENLKDIKKFDVGTKRKQYKEGRANEEVAQENKDIQDFIKEVFPEAERIKDIPDGPEKRNIRDNIIANNMGLVRKLATEALKTSERKNIPVEQRLTRDQWEAGYLAEMIKLIDNYKPGSIAEIGAYLQNKKTGLPIKYGDILKFETAGEVKGKKVGEDKAGEKGVYQKQIILNKQEQGISGIKLYETFFEKTVKSKDGITRVETDIKKQKEVFDNITEIIDKIAGRTVDSKGNVIFKSAEKIADLNYVDLRNFAVEFLKSTGKFQEALPNEISHKIYGRKPQERMDFLGEKWDIFNKLLGSSSVVKYSGTKSDLAKGGKEGRAVFIRDIIKDNYYKPGKRVTTTFDATGAAVPEFIRIEGLSKAEFLKRAGIEMYRKPSADGTLGEVGYRWIPGTTAAKKLVMKALFNEANRVLNYQTTKAWIQKNYNQAPELMNIISENMLIARISGGKADAMYSESMSKYFKGYGFKNVTPASIQSAFRRYEIDAEKLRKQDPKVFKAVKDFVEFAVATEAMIGKTETKQFTTHVKKMTHDFVKTGYWRASRNEFANNKTYLEDYMTNSFDLASIIPWKSIAQQGNLNRIVEMFAVHSKSMTVESGVKVNADVKKAGLDRLDLVKNKLIKGIKENLNKDIFKNEKGESILDADLLKRWENFDFETLAGAYASQNIKAVERIWGQEGVKQKQKLAREYFGEKGGKNLLEFYDLWNATLENWLHKGKNKKGEIIDTFEGSTEWNNKANFIAKLKKNNGAIGKIGERNWAPPGYMYLPARSLSLGRKPKGEKEIIAWEKRMKADPDYKTFYKHWINKGLEKAEAESRALEELKIKYEHLKTSNEQSIESLDLILNNKWRVEGVDKLKNYQGIWGLLGGFNRIDVWGKTNTSGVYRFASNLELTKEIYSVESGFKRTLYQDIVAKIGKQEVFKWEQMIEHGRNLISEQIKKAPKVVKSGELNSESLNRNKQIYDKAIEEGRKIIKKKRGISVWDFDDTLAKTKSQVKYTTPDGKKGKLNAKEYARDYVELAKKGYKFDFSEFNQVVKGEKGPFFKKFVDRVKKFGVKDNFILTARPAESAPAIKEFLKSQGFDIPLENIKGLANSTAEAKAMWMLEKFAEGYNDFYFADDAIKNVKAVRDVLNQLDVKSKVQQAKEFFSEKMSKDFNEIIQDIYGVESFKEFSKARAQLVGADKKSKSLLGPGAQDFMGLMQNFMGKGARKGGKGDQHFEFFKKNITDPYSRGMNDLNVYRQTIMDDFKKLKDLFPEIHKKGGDYKNKEGVFKKIPKSDFTYEHAIRAYLWTKSGYDIPGLSKTEARRLNQTIKNDAMLQTYAEKLRALSKQETGWVEPKEYWLNESVMSDLWRITQTTGREKFLAEFIENKNFIFSEKNLNKIEATQGKRFRESLEDILYRMEHETQRGMGSDPAVNSFNKFVNNAVAATMFLNMRSAVVQGLSTINFVNWTDNNPYKAGKAFANQKQFWKDFSFIWNSPFLKQRRAGLKINVQEAELAAAVSGAKNKAEAAVAYLLKKGYTPTTLMDSFAITTGGSTFYRNRINTYLKKGLSKRAAEKKAWMDFYNAASKAQQSSRPDLISKIQVGPAGRLVFGWGNTQFQQTRLFEKAFRNELNGRGDSKANWSQMWLYGFQQPLMYAALSAGLFALYLDEDDTFDEKDKKDKAWKTVNTMMDSQVRGWGFGGAISTMIKNTVLEAHKQQKKGFTGDHTYTMLQIVGLSPPLSSNLRKIYSGIQEYRFGEDLVGEMGFTLDNPAAMTSAKIIEGVTNVPLARIMKKRRNVQEVLDGRNQWWQRVAHGLGWSSWDLGTEWEELDILKDEVKLKKKYPGKNLEQIKVIQQEKAVFKLNKEQQIKILKTLKLSDEEIKNLKLEKDRVAKIIELRNKKKKEFKVYTVD
tara:strand:+ start:645 stop:9911 length:9267 start_codon:yes stop_codon:yes gene_type:complete